jgi:hypothetical protein
MKCRAMDPVYTVRIFLVFSGMFRFAAIRFHCTADTCQLQRYAEICLSLILLLVRARVWEFGD